MKYEIMRMPELKSLARDHGLRNYSRMRKAELVAFLTMSDDKLPLPQKVIHLQKGVDDSTRRKTYYALLQGQLLEKCFLQSKKVYKATLEETKITRQWSIFL